MPEIINILKCGADRTVYTRGGQLIVRFDSENDRARWEALCRFHRCVDEQNAKAAAGVIMLAINEGVIDDADEFLDAIADDDTRKIIGLEFDSMSKEALNACAAAIEGIWK